MNELQATIFLPAEVDRTFIPVVRQSTRIRQQAEVNQRRLEERENESEVESEVESLLASEINVTEEETREFMQRNNLEEGSEEEDEEEISEDNNEEDEEFQDSQEYLPTNNVSLSRTPIHSRFKATRKPRTIYPKLKSSGIEGSSVNQSTRLNRGQSERQTPTLPRPVETPLSPSNSSSGLTQVLERIGRGKQRDIEMNLGYNINDESLTEEDFIFLPEDRRTPATPQMMLEDRGIRYVDPAGLWLSTQNVESSSSGNRTPQRVYRHSRSSTVASPYPRRRTEQETSNVDWASP